MDTDPHTARDPAPRIAPLEGAQAAAPETRRETVFAISDLTVAYGQSVAVKGVTLDIFRHQITAVIGPSGCGKSTFLRCLNRMNDLVPNVRVDGSLMYHGLDLYARSVDPIEVRRRIGMV